MIYSKETKFKQLMVGKKYAIGGTHYVDGTIETYYVYGPTLSQRIWFSLPTVRFQFERNTNTRKRKRKGITFQFNSKFWSLFWEPYSEGYIDKSGKYHKSSKFSYIHYDLKKYIKKGNLMNDVKDSGLARSNEASRQVKEEGKTLVPVKSETVQTPEDRGEDSVEVTQ